MTFWFLDIFFKASEQQINSWFARPLSLARSCFLSLLSFFLSLSFPRWINFATFNSLLPPPLTDSLHSTLFDISLFFHLPLILHLFVLWKVRPAELFRIQGIQKKTAIIVRAWQNGEQEVMISKGVCFGNLWLRKFWSGRGNVSHYSCPPSSLLDGSFLRGCIFWQHASKNYIKLDQTSWRQKEKEMLSIADGLTLLETWSDVSNVWVNLRLSCS